jgi:hypothetical protein
MLDIGLRIRWLPNSRSGVCAMADENYIRQLSSALKDRIKADEEQTRKENREADILKTESPKQWLELKAWLKEAIVQLNRGVATEVVTLTEGRTLDEITLQCNVGKKHVHMEVKFFDVVGGGNINAKGNGFDGSFDAEIEGRVVCWTIGRHERITIEGIGKRILEAAIKP